MTQEKETLLITLLKENDNDIISELFDFYMDLKMQRFKLTLPESYKEKRISEIFPEMFQNGGNNDE